MEHHRDLLQRFVRVGVVRHRRDRLTALLQTKRGRTTLRKMLHHDLRDQLDPARIVGALPEVAWGLPAVRFADKGPDCGVEFETLRDADRASIDSSLCITLDARYAIVRPETFVDHMALLCLV